MNKGLLIAAVCLLPLALAGCASEMQQREGQPAPHFGDAVKRNILAQTVDPDAGQYQDAQTMNGERAALAQKRYATGKVIKPEDISVSDAQNGNGNSNSGMSGSSGP